MEWKTKTIPSTAPNKLIVILSCEDEEGDLIEVGELILTKKEWKCFNRIMDEGTKAIENYPSERKTWEREEKKKEISELSALTCPHCGYSFVPVNPPYKTTDGKFVTHCLRCLMYFEVKDKK